jgi:hypothetical protein
MASCRAFSSPPGPRHPSFWSVRGFLRKRRRPEMKRLHKYSTVQYCTRISLAHHLHCVCFGRPRSTRFSSPSLSTTTPETCSNLFSSRSAFQRPRPNDLRGVAAALVPFPCLSISPLPNAALNPFLPPTSLAVLGSDRIFGHVREVRPPTKICRPCAAVAALETPLR